MKILGIDPGIATTGLASLTVKNKASFHDIDWLTVTTPANTPLSDRLHEIEHDLATYLDDIQPDLAVVERLFFATNQKTAIDVAHARGVILLTLASRGIPLLEPTPLELKSSLTGDGSADKRQVQDMLVQMLNLTEAPTPDDAADALALAVFGALQQDGVYAISATQAA